jgi:zinc and cadmium transporter
MGVWGNTLVSVVVVSLLSLLGIFTLALDRERLQKALLLLVSFAVGGLFGDTFIHLAPEAFKDMGFKLSTSLYFILGILIFFVLEKVIRWRHCHDDSCQEAKTSPFVAINLIGDTFHNMIDGVVIAASYSISYHVGLTTTIAVMLHEIPHEIGDFGVFVHGGLSVKKALLFNFLSALASIVGAIIFLLVGPLVADLKLILIPVTAGGFIYLAGSDLIPELHHEHNVKITKSLLQLGFMLLGVAIMTLLIFVE